MSKGKKFNKIGMVNAYDDQHTGPEPEWSNFENATPEEVNDKMLRALNFYTYYRANSQFLELLRVISFHEMLALSIVPRLVFHFHQVLQGLLWHISQEDLQVKYFGALSH